jgi:hypothetical protein
MQRDSNRRDVGVLPTYQPTNRRKDGLALANSKLNKVSIIYEFSQLTINAH